MKRIFHVLLLAAALFLAVRLDLVHLGAEKNIAATLAPGNRVVMYSLTTCPYCKATHAKLIRAGIPFTEYFLDTDPSRMQELGALLRASHVPPGSVGTPTIEVNGTLLINNPDMKTIRRHLKYRS